MATTPERRRLAQSRWRATILFALTTTTSLVVLAGFASVIDTRSHTRETVRELSDIAEQLSTDARTSTAGTTFDSQGVQAWRSVDGTFAYVDDRGIEVASPSQGALPDAADIDVLVARAHRTTTFVTVDASTAATGLPYHWVALAVPYASTVVLAGASAAPTPSHRTLDLLLALIVLALAVLGTGLGHILSGLAMRPALRGIQQHEQFLREAAHELRTPLAVLRLAVATRPQTEADHRVVAAQVERMSGLVTRLLDRARIRGADASAIVLEPLRLDQLVELAVEDVVGADDVRLELEPVVVDGHAGLLEQAVRNLIENALRHGGAPVTVVVRDGRLTVADSGAGVPAAGRRRLLVGGRGDGTGTGTGLAIVSWVTSIHHADIRLQDAHPHGLSVTVAFRHRGPSAGSAHS